MDLASVLEDVTERRLGLFNISGGKE
jgi:hypothetical protein